jgi:hypothetical protein
MQQQINLYQPLFRRQEKLFSAKKLLGLFVGAALFFTAIYAYARWNVYALETQLVEMNKQYDRELKRIDELSRQFPVKQKNIVMEQQLTALRLERDAKQTLIGLLRGKSAFGNVEGFSGHMEGIARQRLDGMWVTGFNLGSGGESIDIHGSSLSPELVPQFLQKLSAEPSFTGAEFRVFKMQRDEKNRAAIDFVLQTEQGSGQTKGAARK